MKPIKENRFSNHELPGGFHETCIWLIAKKENKQTCLLVQPIHCATTEKKADSYVGFSDLIMIGDIDQAVESLIVEDENEELELRLKNEAHRVIKLISPVTLCMAFVVATISTIPLYTIKGIYLVYTPIHEQTDNAGTLVLLALANGGILVVLIAVRSAIMALSKYRGGCRRKIPRSCHSCLVAEAIAYRCSNFIRGYFLISSLICLSFLDHQHLTDILEAYNLPFDLITTTILI